MKGQQVVTGTVEVVGGARVVLDELVNDSVVLGCDGVAVDLLWRLARRVHRCSRPDARSLAELIRTGAAGDF